MDHNREYLNPQNKNEQHSKIDLTSLFRDALRQWWVILIFALSVSFAADLWSFYSYEPRYTILQAVQECVRSMLERGVITID